MAKMRRILPSSVALCMTVLCACLPLSAAPAPADRPSVQAAQAPGANSLSIAAASQRAGLPLYFLKNQGQVDRQARFYSQTSQYTLWFTESGLVFDRLVKAPGAAGKPDSPKSLPGKSCRDVSRLEFVGANPSPALSGSEEQPYRVNFFKGNDRSQWRTGIPSFAAVSYGGIYENIDLKVYGMESRIEYDWQVRPGGDPQAIRFAYRGARRTAITRQGDLRVKTAFGELTHKRPAAYQEIDGARVPVKAAFKKIAGDVYGFAVGPYDRALTLTIDPLVFCTYLGGSGDPADQGLCITTDGIGEIYVAGMTRSGDFPTTVGAFDTSSNGMMDIFVTKMNASGSALIYSTFLGGGQVDTPSGLRPGSGGYIYLTGYTASDDFPTTSGAYIEESPAAQNGEGFITVLNSSGDALYYSTYLGTYYGEEKCLGIALDSSEAAYVVGTTNSVDFPTTAGAYDTSHNGDIDTFVVKFNFSATPLVYSTFLGGGYIDIGTCIAVDSDTMVYVAGYTLSNNFPTTAGAFATTPVGGLSEAFVTKLNQTGTGLVYSTYFGGDANDQATGIMLDSAKNAYVCGGTDSTDLPTTIGAFDTSDNGGNDGFITKLNPTGSGLVYSTYLGGSSEDTIKGIRLDGGNQAYVTGYTSSSDFPTSAGAQDVDFNGLQDAFISALSATGASLNYSTYLGGSNYDYGMGISVDNSPACYVTGHSLSDSTTFPVTAGAFSTTLNGEGDAFVAKLSLAPTLTTVSPNGGEHWTLGATKSITWNAENYTGTVRLVLFKGGLRFGNIATGIPAASGSYSWTVGQTLDQGTAPAGSDFRFYLRSSDNTLVDPGDFRFSLIPPSQLQVTSPNGGENLRKGFSHTITWKAQSGVTGTVRLVLFKNAAKIGQIATGIDVADKSYTWVVGQYAGGTAPAGGLYSIRILSTDGTESDFSDGPFAISEP